MSSTRLVSGSIVRGIVDWVVKSELRAMVYPLVPAGAQHHFDHPPLPIAWIDPATYDPFFPAIAQVGGMDLVVRCGYEATRTSFGPIVQPILKGMLKIFGGGPDAIFSHMDSVTRVLFKGVNFDYAATGTGSGALTITAPDRPAPEWFHSWSGALAFAFELTRTQGKPVAARILPGGNAARYELAWTAAAGAAAGT